ncbi:MAG: hypothetical protein Q8S03_07790 [Brevundimonas sp.]|uniref:hypothetical protein n=1 Tax=Brevundimonas sp. TaxID=1871086 RepID=UPI002735FB8D|nr:hypothetical protein [Brevundimonas sp.]MDP3404574.1 hypothetical protein [Brevundimonas sp.]
MKTLFPIVSAALLLAAAPSAASERPGHGGCGGGCGGGQAGGGYNANVNVNVNASASATARSGAFINARAYDVQAIGARGAVYGGVISTGGDYGPGYGYVGPGHGPVVIGGPGYGPSRPHGYVVYGLGRRYVTTDLCGACGYGPPPPPPSCHDVCRSHGHDRGYHERDHGRAGTYARSVNVAGSYSVRESYSEHAAWSEGYERHTGRGHERVRPDRPYRDDGPRHAPIPYHAAPLEPVPYAQGHPYRPADHAPPPVHYSGPAPAPYHPEPPVAAPAPLGYHGDLPPGDSGEGMPYRQEPGERG